MTDLRDREKRIMEYRDQGLGWTTIAEMTRTSQTICKNLYRQAEQRQDGAECCRCGRSESYHPLGHDNLVPVDGDEYVCRDCFHGRGDEV